MIEIRNRGPEPVKLQRVEDGFDLQFAGPATVKNHDNKPIKIYRGGNLIVVIEPGEAWSF